MNASTSKRYDKLLKIAQEDEFYQVLERMYRNCREESGELLKDMPFADRAVIHGYANAGRYMYKWMVHLACENMIFPDEKRPDDQRPSRKLLLRIFKR